MAGNTENTGDDPTKNGGSTSSAGKNTENVQHGQNGRNTEAAHNNAQSQQSANGSSNKTDGQSAGNDQYTGWDNGGKPHFGQMRDQYGPNYNPYKYGAPTPDNGGNRNQNQNNRNQNGRNQNGAQNQNGNAAWSQANPGWGGNGTGNGQANGNGGNGYQNGPQGPANGYGPGNGYGPNGYGPNNGFGPAGYGAGNTGNPGNGTAGNGYGPNAGYNGGNGYNGNGNGYGPNGQYRNPQGGWNPPQGQNQGSPFGMQQFNPDDPNQNPVFGKWDWTAVFAFILSLSAYFCFIALPLGFYAYRRDTVLHMKGKGFAVAAIVISILEIIGFIILLLNPGLLQSVMSSAGLSGSGTASSGLVQTLFLLG